MTDTKPKALRWAQSLEASPYLNDKIVAAELRRLHEVNADLLEALKQVMIWIDNWNPEFTYNPAYAPKWSADNDKARAAIAKATGEQA